MTREEVIAAAEQALQSGSRLDLLDALHLVLDALDYNNSNNLKEAS